MATQVLNTDTNLTGKTLMAAENAETVTGLKTFDRDPSAPFAVTASSAVVPNLDADKLDGLEATDFVKKDGTVAMTGKLDLGTPGQLQFPATQNPSSDANVLDDYEEGTWTPAVAFGGNSTGLTYSSRAGRYVKIGRLVIAECEVVLSAKGSSTGTATLSGLPFAAQGNVAGYFDPNAGFSGLTGALALAVASSAGTFVQQSSTGRTPLTDSNFGNSTNFRATVVYIATQ